MAQATVDRLLLDGSMARAAGAMRDISHERGIIIHVERGAELALDLASRGYVLDTYCIVGAGRPPATTSGSPIWTRRKIQGAHA